jgi:hypothetical protein
MTPSVSEIPGGGSRPGPRGPIGLMTWGHAGPLVTVVVRCSPVVRGPDVAPMWPGDGELAGTAAEDDVARAWSIGHQLHYRVRLVLGDPRPRGQAARRRGRAIRVK